MRPGGVRGAFVPCPSPELIRALHAATFHFEHGSAADGRASLELARHAPGERDATASEVLARLERIERAIDAGPKSAAVVGELERSRLAFREWRCFPEPLHEDFHRSLPPLPSLPGAQ